MGVAGTDRGLSVVTIETTSPQTPTIVTFPGDLSASRTVTVPIPAGATSATIGIGWTGTPVGTLDFRMLMRADDADGTLYSTIKAGWTNPAGAAASQSIAISTVGYTAFAIVYTRASSTGTWTGADGTRDPVVVWGAQ